MDTSLIIDSDDKPWRDSPAEGVKWKKLYFDPESGRSEVLLKFAPGASYDAHRHPEGEEYLVLAGSLEDGGTTYGAGSHVKHPPGSVHKPSSRQGCLLFVRLPKPIEPV